MLLLTKTKAIKNIFVNWNKAKKNIILKKTILKKYNEKLEMLHWQLTEMNKVEYN